MPGPAPSVNSPFEEMRDAAGELDHFEPALDVALGVGEGLAVLGGEQPGEAVVLLLRQLEELEQHARAPLRIGGSPGRLRGLRHWRSPARPRTCWRSATLACTSPVLGSNTSPKRPEVPLHLLAADEVADARAFAVSCKS